MDNDKSSSSLPENIVAGIGYLFLWISGIIVYLTEKRSSFVKTHAAQSIIVFGLLTTLIFISWIFSFLPVLGLIFWWAQTILSLITGLLWIFLLYYSLSGRIWIVPGFERWIHSIAEEKTPTLF